MAFFSTLSLGNRVFLLVGSLLTVSMILIWGVIFPQYQQAVLEERLTVIAEQQNYAIQSADNQVLYWSETIRFISNALLTRPNEFDEILKNEISLNPEIIKVQVLDLITNEEIQAQNTNYSNLSIKTLSLFSEKLPANESIKIAFQPKSDSLPPFFVFTQQVVVKDAICSVVCFFDASSFKQSLLEIPIGEGIIVKVKNKRKVLFENTSAGSLPEFQNTQSVTTIKQFDFNDESWHVLISPVVQTPYEMILAVPESLILKPAKQLLLYSTTFMLGVLILMTGIGWIISKQVTKPVQKLTNAVDAISRLDFSASIEKPKLPELIPLYNIIEAMRLSLDRYNKLNVEKLIVEEWKNRILMTYTPDMIGWGDENGKFVFKNKRLEELLQELNQPTIQTRHEFFNKLSFEVEREIRQNENISNYQLDFRKAELSIKSNNNEYHFDLQDVELFSEQKEPKGFLIILHDLTNDRVLEQTKQETLALIVHELRNPLLSINGFTELMLNQIYEPEKFNRYISAIFESGTKLNELVDRFLRVLRMESGETEIEKSPINLVDIVSHLIDALEASAQKKSIKFALKVDGTIPEIMASEHLILEAIQNLMVNAINYGQVNRTIDMNIQSDQKNVVLSITDYGFGISGEDQEKLFTKFYRVKNEKTKDISGSGLGLAYVKEIINKHQGKITLESNSKIGCKFTVILPV